MTTKGIKQYTDEMDQLYFVCYMVERVARKIHQRNKYVVNKIGKDNLVHYLEFSDVLHSENPLKIEDEWIVDNHLEEGVFDITDVNPQLCNTIPSALDMGGDYMRLILDTLEPDESYVDGIIRVYNHPICKIIDNYNGSAYYEPSYVIKQAYYDGTF